MSETAVESTPRIEENVFVAKVENSALMAAPVWESHQRGKNWMAVITTDPASPGGYARQFCARGKGAYYYIVDPSIIGKAVEFGADYYSGRGVRRPLRYYGVVLSLTDSEIRIRQHDTGRQACRAAAENTGPDRADLIAEREKLIARLAEINAILGDE